MITIDDPTNLGICISYPDHFFFFIIILPGKKKKTKQGKANVCDINATENLL